jgi:hypothetical protein
MPLDKALLHFLQIFSDKIYIGILNWAMVGNFCDLKESRYIHKNKEEKSNTIQNKWWVAIELNYVHPLPGSYRDL